MKTGETHTCEWTVSNTRELCTVILVKCPVFSPLEMNPVVTKRSPLSRGSKATRRWAAESDGPRLTFDVSKPRGAQAGFLRRTRGHMGLADGDRRHHTHDRCADLTSRTERCYSLPLLPSESGNRKKTVYFCGCY